MSMLMEGAAVERAFWTPWERALNWADLPLEYDENDIAAYGILRSRFFSSYQLFLTSHSQGFNTMISIGAGEGDCIMSALSYFHCDRVILTDINPTSLRKAKGTITASSKVREVKAYKASHENLLEVCDTAEVNKSQTIGFAVGCLTRKVVNGSYSASKCVQQAFRSCAAFGVAGVTIPLLTKESLRRMGWKATHYQHSTDVHLFTAGITSLYLMCQPTPDERQAYLAMALKIPNLLDLYLCADPLLYVSEIKGVLDEVTLLDLRYAYFKDKEECNLFLELIQKKLPGLKSVRVDREDAWLTWGLCCRDIQIKIMKSPDPAEELHMRKNLLSTEILQIVCAAEEKVKPSLGVQSAMFSSPAVPTIESLDEYVSTLEL